MTRIRNTILGVVLCFIIASLVGAPRVPGARDIFQAIYLENEIKTLYRQVKDFSHIDSQNVVGKVLYEPTGETFSGPQEIKAAIPERKERLAKLLMEYNGYGPSR